MLTLPLTSSKPLIPHITCPQGCSPNPTFSKSGNGTASARVSSGAGLGCRLLWRSGVWVRQKWVWSQALRPSCTPLAPQKPHLRVCQSTSSRCKPPPLATSCCIGKPKQNPRERHPRPDPRRPYCRHWKKSARVGGTRVSGLCAQRHPQGEGGRKGRGISSHSSFIHGLPGPRAPSSHLLDLTPVYLLSAPPVGSSRVPPHPRPITPAAQ